MSLGDPRAGFCNCNYMSEYFGILSLIVLMSTFLGIKTNSIHTSGHSKLLLVILLKHSYKLVKK